jgi:hypothetical protein
VFAAGLGRATEGDGEDSTGTVVSAGRGVEVTLQAWFAVRPACPPGVGLRIITGWAMGWAGFELFAVVPARLPVSRRFGDPTTRAKLSLAHLIDESFTAAISAAPRPVVSSCPQALAGLARMIRSGTLRAVLLTCVRKQSLCSHHQRTLSGGLPAPRPNYCTRTE